MNFRATFAPRSFFATRSVCFMGFVLLTCLLPAEPAHAQDSASRASACVSPAMVKLLTREGNSVHVAAGTQLAARQPGARENEQGIAAAQNPESLRTLQQAHDWFEKGARRGYAPAQVNLAVASLAGWGMAPNAGAALYWLREAANHGYVLAYYDLGILYMNGCGVRQDYGEALRFFELGADSGDAAAQMNLGYLYDQGLGVAQNRATAAGWYRKAAETGVAQAQYNLADLYVRGDGVSQDDTQAFAWFQKAALQGHSGARILLGSMYAAGRGTPKDPQLAYVWIFAATLQGDDRGRSMLPDLALQLSEPELAEMKARAQSLIQTDKRSGEVALLH